MLTNDQIKKQLVRYYDANAEDRNQTTKSEWKVKVRATFLACLKETGARSLLEIGAGTGQDCLFFMDNGLKVTGIDLSPKQVAVCRAKGIDAYTMDLFALDCADASYDALYSLNTLLHVPKKDLSTALTELKRVLKPGGLFFLGVYGGEDVESTGDDEERFFALYSFRAYSGILQQHFTIVSSESINLDRPTLPPQFHSFTLAKHT